MLRAQGSILSKNPKCDQKFNENSKNLPQSYYNPQSHKSDHFAVKLNNIIGLEGSR